MTGNALYSFRPHAFVDESTWRLDDGALTREQSGEATRFPLVGAIEVRLMFDPSRVVHDRFRCKVRFRGGREIVLINQSYAGIAEFENRSNTYVSFVRELVTQIARASPPCRFRAGKPAFQYFMSLAFVFAMLLLLAAVLWLTAPVSWHWLVIIKLVVIAAMLPTFYLYVRKNRPRPFDPAAIPPDLLPSVEAAP
jgi:hypothetical protein